MSACTGLPSPVVVLASSRNGDSGAAALAWRHVERIMEILVPHALLTPRGPGLVASLGLEAGPLRHTRRIFALSCNDWMLRRPHLAGALPAALTERFLALGWLARAGDRRLRVHPDYDRCLEEWLSLARAHDGAC